MPTMRSTDCFFCPNEVKIDRVLLLSYGASIAVVASIDDGNGDFSGVVE
jgi:hypothetical protein